MKFLLTKKLLILMLAGHTSATLDAWTTRRFLDHHANDSRHAYEVNPLLRPFSGPSLFYAAIQADALVADGLLARSKHRKLAVAFTVVVISLHIAAASHNVVHQAAIERQLAGVIRTPAFPAGK